MYHFVADICIESSGVCTVHIMNAGFSIMPYCEYMLQQFL